MLQNMAAISFGIPFHSLSYPRFKYYNVKIKPVCFQQWLFTILLLSSYYISIILTSAKELCSLQALRLARCLRDNKYPNILFFKCKGQTFRNSPRNEESQIETDRKFLIFML